MRTASITHMRRRLRLHNSSNRRPTATNNNMATHNILQCICRCPCNRVIHSHSQRRTRSRRSPLCPGPRISSTSNTNRCRRKCNNHTICSSIQGKIHSSIFSRVPSNGHNNRSSICNSLCNDFPSNPPNSLHDNLLNNLPSRPPSSLHSDLPSNPYNSLFSDHPNSRSIDHNHK